MKSAPVVVIDEYPGMPQMLERHLDAAGHSVTGTAINLEQSFKLIDEIELGTVACRFIILDTIFQSNTQDGGNAKAIVDQVDHKGLREELGLHIIGFSARLLKQEFNIPVDFEVEKTGQPGDIQNLIAIISTT